MIEAFANESETANIDNENPTASYSKRSLANDTDQTEVTSRTLHISHFSPTGKTEAGLFRLHQQHTHLDITGEDGPSKRPTEQRNLPI